MFEKDMFKKYMFEDKLLKFEPFSKVEHGKSFTYVTLKEESAEKRKEFVEAMNKLLLWAGIPALEAEDLL